MVVSPLYGSVVNALKSTFKTIYSPRVRHKSQNAFSICFKTYGSPSNVLEKVDFVFPKKLQPSEILVEMLAAPINPADLNTIQGTYALKPTLPAVAGMEGVGKVIEVADDVKNVVVGDLVLAAAAAMGTWTTHAVWKANEVVKAPSDIPLLSAATISVNSCSAYRMLKDFEQLNPGDTVIQNGANSAVGQSVISIAKELGIITINVVRKRPNVSELEKRLENLGADYVLLEENLRSQSTLELFKSIPRPKLALNCVGGKSATELTRLLCNGGTLVTYGGMSRQPITVVTSSLIFKDIKIRGYWMTRWKDEHLGSSETNEMYEFLFNMARTGKLKPPENRTLSLDNFQEGVKKAMEPFIGKKYIFTMN